MRTYLETIKNWSNLSGRLSKKDYWIFFLVNFIISTFLLMINTAAYYIYLIFIIIPGFSAGWRRIQDTKRSGWWVLVPFVNFIFSLLPRREKIDIYVKIFTNNFPEYPWKKYATSEQVVKFLLSDCGCAFDERKKEYTPLRYLGLGEKFGELEFKEQKWKWGYGEASLDTVKEFIDWMYLDEFLNEEQYRKLIDVIEEGRKIEDM